MDYRKTIRDLGVRMHEAEDTERRQRAEVMRLEHALENSEAQVRALERDLENAQERKDAAVARADDANERIETMTEQQNELDREMDDLHDTMRDMQRTIERLVEFEDIRGEAQQALAEERKRSAGLERAIDELQKQLRISQARELSSRMLGNIKINMLQRALDEARK